MAQGYVNFISRLMSSTEMQGVNISLAVPDAAPTPSRPFILRLDGVYFYKFTVRNFLNYAITTRPSFKPMQRGADVLGFGLGMSKIFNRWLNRFVISKSKQASGLVFQSQLSKKMYETFVHTIDRPFTVITNGVDLEIFKPLQQISLPIQEIHLCITANFRPHKRLGGAVSIANELEERLDKPVKLHVAGAIDPITKANLKDLDTSSVIFHGQLEESQLRDLYGSCHAGLATAIFDPCPNAVIEMMACGLPVVTCSNSGAAELVGWSDLIVDEHLDLNYTEFQTPIGLPVCEKTNWVDKLLLVIECNDEFRLAVRQRCEELYDIETIARQYKAFYEKVFSASGWDH